MTPLSSHLLRASGTLLLALTLPLHAADSAREKPNIIVMIADDLGWGDVSCLANGKVRTPNIDRIALTGVKFTSGYVTAPLCGPSRAGFFSGMYQHRFGFTDNSGGIPVGQSLMPDVLRQAGYRTALIGKWHSKGPMPHERGCFDETLCSDVSSPFIDYFHPKLARNGKVEEFHEYSTDLFAREATAFIDRNQARPFALTVTFNAPHILRVIQHYEQIRKDFDAAQVAGKIHDIPKAPMARPGESAKFADQFPGDTARADTVATIAALDEAVGRILDKLRQTGLEKKTMVFFFADNGAHPENRSENLPLREYKWSLYEGGIRVPFLACYPDVFPAGLEYSQPVSTLDIFATCAAHAGARPTGPLDGVNLTPYLRGEKSAPPHEALFFSISGSGAVRQDQWKLVMPAGGKPQLFDLSKDVAETHDLASAEPSRVQDLNQSWKEWHEKVSVSSKPSASQAKSFPVSITIDAAKPGARLRPIWRYFGADEPNYAYMKNGSKLLGELGELAPKQVYFRAHNMLTSGDGTPDLKWGSTNAYTENANGQPIYDWSITDRIFDVYLENGVRPYVQLGFMPQALSLKPEPYRHHWTPASKYGEIYLGWTSPPKDYAKWGELCHQWAKHCVEKYGREEVETWWWELWNEPNIGYWSGTQEEFYKLYDYSVDGVRRAIPRARIGGPETAGGPGGGTLEKFLKHCVAGTNAVTGKKGTPIDLISFHAKGQPKFVEDHVRMGISRQLQDIDKAFAVIAGFPTLKQLPVVIGECDPEGCAACRGPQYGYRNGTMYSSYTAASFARLHDLAEKHDINLEGALTWAFEFEGHPCFAGFRALASDGIDHPVMNVFRMFSKMSGRRLPVAGDGAVSLDEVIKNGVRNRPDVSALASLDDRKLAVMLWHYHDDDVAGPDAAIALRIPGFPIAKGPAMLAHYRIGPSLSNAYTVWKSLGQPAHPDEKQREQLERAGQLARMTSATPTVEVENGVVTLPLSLPRQAVSLLLLEW